MEVRYMLIQVAANDPAKALVENLMDEMGGEVLEEITMDTEVPEFPPVIDFP